MMKKLFYGINLFGLLALLVFINSCDDSSEEETDPCLNGPVASVSNVNKSVQDENNGSFTVDVTGGQTPYMYSIDGTTFQESANFSDLAPAIYSVTVKDANECTATETVEIEEIPVVSFASEVDPIIQANCQVATCHGANTGIPDFGSYANISAKASRIKARTGDGSMPPSGSLSSADVQLIADWVDQGAPDN
ncbi:hypothetical protein ACFLU5_05345 [Bacteroidota bacterium]